LEPITPEREIPIALNAIALLGSGSRNQAVRGNDLAVVGIAKARSVMIVSNLTKGNERAPEIVDGMGGTGPGPSRGEQGERRLDAPGARALAVS
jgi:hypothetical protein